MLTRQYALWNRWLIGYNCWPFNEFKVNIVGWAAREASDLGWADDSLGKLYIGDLDDKGSPQCHENCYRYVDDSPGGWSESSGCKGKPFDVSLWPTCGMGGGLGNYNFQQVDLDDMMEHIDDDELRPRFRPSGLLPAAKTCQLQALPDGYAHFGRPTRHGWLDAAPRAREQETQVHLLSLVVGLCEKEARRCC
ncbi:hypothetical protein PF005_g13265 [Phytophthora fragariae]|uniref:Uncharacterized protein n=1 Tax=Phytophthora fragariae TaxID=53985 RepID=A0A6A3RPK6_9STRA|nr:hypothetical protein PF003_g40357 [Phytophthora fragariae]KAE8941000.1 hypothetical protein PF009_g9209 [Phytophthora fragariae]KAE8990071.1 hypothetical protein PF011_g18505 [Phytophthora fragariae]KAE9096202.1 hypothetical protein PF010_g16430 [Phytophthora fragariae]KAE9100022.1 hypothetical protein PF006_g23001 [Phytophthora fragariae]